MVACESFYKVWGRERNLRQAINCIEQTKLFLLMAKV